MHCLGPSFWETSSNDLQSLFASHFLLMRLNWKRLFQKWHRIALVSRAYIERIILTWVVWLEERMWVTFLLLTSTSDPSSFDGGGQRSFKIVKIDISVWGKNNFVCYIIKYTYIIVKKLMSTHLLNQDSNPVVNHLVNCPAIAQNHPRILVKIIFCDLKWPWMS